MSVPKPQNYFFGEFRLDAAKRLLLRDGQAMPLTPKAFDTLLHLVENRGQVIEKDALMAAVWPDTVVEENNLNQNVSALRRALGESRGENRFIATVPGRGYRFVADVIAGSTEADPAAKEVAEAAAPPKEALEADAPAQEKLDAVTTASAGGRRKWLFPALAGLVVAAAIAGLAYRGVLRRSVEGASAGVRSLAVLPFRPLVASGHDEVLEMGMADTLITKLSNLSDVTVRPMAVIRKFTDPNQDPAAVGRQLQVDAVLDGSIQKDSGRVRVTVRLVRASDGKQLWSNRYDEQAGDIFAVQDSISERVASELAGKLTSEEQALLRKRYTADTEAYELYLKGIYFWEKRTREGTGKAIDYFQQALARDPNYALAYVGIANCYSAMPISGDVPSRDAFPKAKEAAIRALEIDGSLAEAHVSLAYIHFFFDWDWEASRAEYQRAIGINPNSSAAHWGYALLLSSLGQHDQAISEIDKAVKLEPLWPMTGALKGHILFQAHRYPDAVTHLEKTLELDDNFWITHIELGKNYESEGQFDDALKSFRRARDLSGGVSETVSLMGYTYAVEGRRAEAEQALKELSAMSNRAYVPPYHFALLYHGLGNSEETFEWLEKAREERDVHMVFLSVDPKWDDLRSDPRFAGIVKLKPI